MKDTNPKLAIAMRIALLSFSVQLPIIDNSLLASLASLAPLY